MAIMKKNEAIMKKAERNLETLLIFSTHDRHPVVVSKSSISVAASTSGNSSGCLWRVIDGVLQYPPLQTSVSVSSLAVSSSGSMGIGISIWSWSS